MKKSSLLNYLSDLKCAFEILCFTAYFKKLHVECRAHKQSSCLLLGWADFCWIKNQPCQCGAKHSPALDNFDHVLLIGQHAEFCDSLKDVLALQNGIALEASREA